MRLRRMRHLPRCGPFGVAAAVATKMKMFEETALTLVESSVLVNLLT
ncbi:hypothetical protein SAMN02982929_06187 [Saccharopolyspora kobensis]|uniref:Uncharacterized protein n=1 Tax=Saccharopolyspora kobensis TaxID=146035 RepID=A0A1H6ECB1_9PSEU|nr:hypothetical protein SAMN02982929_06187 [Saccharopolyspora kobensis]SFD56650.1 hypothetical protein SAMN05216506_10599 [Saccharopolyspora kobensis]